MSSTVCLDFSVLKEISMEKSIGIEGGSCECMQSLILFTETPLHIAQNKFLYLKKRQTHNQSSK